VIRWGNDDSDDGYVVIVVVLLSVCSKNLRGTVSLITVKNELVYSIIYRHITTQLSTKFTKTHFLSFLCH
jgi:hypothetical protein